jgi:alpha-L-fucosidase
LLDLNGKAPLLGRIKEMSVTKLNRRNFVAGTLAAAAFPALNKIARTAHAAAAPRAIPSADILAWQNLEIGMFVHFAPNTFQDKEGDDLSTPLSAINPDIDTDNWAQCALNLGARYIVFVAKHAGGFCMWQTETTPYSIGHTPWKGGKGDVLADLSASCRKHRLGLGVYLSPRDDYFGANVGGVCKDSSRQPAYNAMYRQQLTEVLTRYGPMVEVWFDGSSVVPTSDLVGKYAAHAAIFQGPDAKIRWVGNEMGFAPYPLWDTESETDAHSGVSTSLHSDPDGSAWVPVECDVSIRRPDWFWSTKNEHNLMTLDQLIEVYYRSVGRGAQLLLNIPADRRGHMPDADFARAREFGDELRRRFGKSVAEISASGERIELPISSSGAPVDHVILQEDCRFGQRVRAFKLEGLAGRQWSEIYSGSSIGHKRIVPFAAQPFTALRLIVTESAGEPKLSRFAAFHTGAATPATWDAPAQAGADDEVGRWQNGKFEIDLTSNIKDAAQYRVRFIPENGRVTSISQFQLLLGGAPAPHLVRPDPTAPNVLIVTMTEIGQKVVLSGTVAGAERGAILLEKM